ncbi:MAG: hypothetical protein H6744_09390 [Deltaproteobacteria bacterium]|nr:hypothetical protein [Deltaproteobacteria bacterium]
MKSSLVALALLVCLPQAARAEEEAGGGGLAASLRSLFYGQLCDSLQAAEVDCAKAPAKCFLQRSNGTPFAPQWSWDYIGYAWPTSIYWELMPAAEKSGNPAGADGTVDPLAQLSGLPSPDAADEDQGVRKLSDQQIAWVLEHLAPRPGETLCGAPAERLYKLMAKRPAQALAKAYLHLSARGAFKGFDREAYLAQAYDPKGRFNKMCDAFIGKPAWGAEQRYKKQACGFWLRREFVGQRDALVRAYAEALGRFDKAMGKRLVAAATKDARIDRGTE